MDGTGNCFVRKTGEPNQYLLGCHHVLALTEMQPPPADVTSISVDWEGARLGALAELPTNVNAVDAAIAHCDAVQPQIHFMNAGSVVTIKSVIAAGAPPPPTFFILTRNGVHRANLLGMVSHTENYYGNGTALTFTNVIHSVAAPGEPQFQDGDSGAPLVDAGGRLIGIHYAGDDPLGADSYALRADVVFRSFSKGLSLS
ncbi:MAG: hypothetical protein ACHREM_22200 [Polyangiales bacterium]